MFIVAVALLLLLMPPPQYDYPPTRHHVVHYVSPSVIAQRCRGLDVMVAQLRNPNARALGCTDLATMDIWINDTLSLDRSEKVLRHERAHVNGWRHR